jgi:hypothetical protein
MLLKCVSAPHVTAKMGTPTRFLLMEYGLILQQRSDQNFSDKIV